MRGPAICFAFVFVLAAPLCPAPAQAQQTFMLLTQNMLRFGHGARLLNQCNAITAAADTADIIVLQEVMTPAYPCIGGNNNKQVNVPIPLGFQYFTSSAKGRSYKEYYGILFRSNVINWLSQNDNLGANLPFMRPPYGVQFRVRNQPSKASCNVWIVDFHAVFGKRRSERQAEARVMENVYRTLRGGANNNLVILAGDWNLEARDTTGFAWVARNGARITPDTLTSLTTAGVPSSAYDHVIYSFNATTPRRVELANVRTYTGNYTKLNWRKAVSDHMGVMAEVTLRC
jgi:endonuclease/exonuclease/phosphatase family metal-dependent hydrolase